MKEASVDAIAAAGLLVDAEDAATRRVSHNPRLCLGCTRDRIAGLLDMVVEYAARIAESEGSTQAAWKIRRGSLTPFASPLYPDNNRTPDQEK